MKITPASLHGAILSNPGMKKNVFPDLTLESAHGTVSNFMHEVLVELCVA